MTDTRTDLQKQSDVFAVSRLVADGLVPVRYSDAMGAVPAGAVFWTRPDRVPR